MNDDYGPRYISIGNNIDVPAAGDLYATYLYWFEERRHTPQGKIRLNVLKKLLRAAYEHGQTVTSGKGDGKVKDDKRHKYVSIGNGIKVSASDELFATYNLRFVRTSPTDNQRSVFFTVQGLMRAAYEHGVMQAPKSDDAA